MSEFKVVSMEPTAEMVEAAQDAYMPFGDMDIALRMALLAAPAVQGEPVAYAVFAGNGNIRIWCADPIQAETLRQQYGEALQPLYTAPQPAEQQPMDEYLNLSGRFPSHGSQQSADTVTDGFKSIPDLPHGFNHCAYNRQTGEWLYINHANTWQLFQGPSHDSEQGDDV